MEGERFPMANQGKLGTQKDLANETKRKANSSEHRLSGWSAGLAGRKEEQMPYKAAPRD